MKNKHQPTQSKTNNCQPFERSYNKKEKEQKQMS